jgi:hypothetical protein
MGRTFPDNYEEDHEDEILDMILEGIDERS